MPDLEQIASGDGDSRPRSAKRWRIVLVAPPVIIGIALLVFVIRSSEEPVRAPLGERASAVRVIDVPRVDLVPRALDYGYVQPGRVWEAVAEVAGRIVEKHPRLKPGELIAAGTVILRIDPTDYQLSVQRNEARIRGAEAEIAELEVREANTRRALEIEERSLVLAETDLRRRRTLLDRGSISQASVDEAERTVLTRRQAVQGLRNELALIPADQEVLLANLDLSRAELAQARSNLERTAVAVPFDGRVAAVNVETAQYATVGKILAVVDGLDTAEVAAQIPLDRMRRLIEAAEMSDVQLTAESAVSLFQRLGLEAVVRLTSGDFTVQWPARFARIRETVDPRTRTIGVVVAVDEPYKQARPGERPPLAKNMYVEVELRGRTQPGRVVVPRSALQNGTVYVVGSGSRLERRTVAVGMRQSDFVVITSGLEAGEQVVVSDLVPAIDGMLLNATQDEDLRDYLITIATGGGVVR